MAVRVVVGEDEPLMREGIVRVLEGSDFEVVGVAGDATDLIRKTNAHRPDVVITDIQMPPDRTDDGLRAAIRIR
jgi:DNA-binding NarL/FixJ family response regulator